jgi:DEAD/DEAH box helicase domain-containing protein
MDPDSLITKRDVLRAQPPDILLTNYKMLDYLLLREIDTPLWEQASKTLRYLVLEFRRTPGGGSARA